jgi:MFS family permease
MVATDAPPLEAIADEKNYSKHARAETSLSGTQSTTNYSAFTKWQKRWIVFIAAFAAWFSTLTSFVFFPIITVLAHGLDTSIQNINLTVTSYLLVAGVAPAITATLADKAGRRPAFLASFVPFLAANIGLALQNSFPALFVLRMLQAAGVAGTFAIVYGVLADIATPAERGSYVGVVAFW